MTTQKQTKPQLPKRLYYSLDDTAKELDCTVSDLLHFAATGKLELCLRVDDDNNLLCFPPQWVMDATHDPDNMECQIITDFGTLRLEGSSILLELKKGNSVLALPLSAARKIEKGFVHNHTYQADFLSLPRNYMAGLAIHFKAGEKTLAIPKVTNHTFDDITDSTVTKEKASYAAFSLDGVTFTAADVVITAKELNLLRQGGETVLEPVALKNDERPSAFTFIKVLFDELLEKHKTINPEFNQSALIRKLSEKATAAGIQGVSQSNQEKMLARANKEYRERTP